MLATHSGLALAADSGPAEGCDKGSESKSFGDRFLSAYSSALKWDGYSPNDPPNWRKDLQPPPTESPPMPFGNWPTGGTSNIGYENMYYGPLMDAIYCGPNGKSIKDSRFTVYGWVNPGLNISTSSSKYNFVSGTGGNFPASYSYQPNTVQLDQLALYFERTADYVQREHNDWGYRVALMYGTDYKYTFSNGTFSNQYTEKKKRYGIDPVMVYGEYYMPNILSGVNVRVGRYISVPDIEAQLAPNNYNYSHSLLYSFDPYTKQGVNVTWKINKNWLFSTELSVGNDVAFWDRKERQFTPGGCLQWTSDSGNDMIYPCFNGVNNGKFGWNNLQQTVVTWYHKFNSKLHISTEAWAMYQKDTPNVLNAAGLQQLNDRYPTGDSVGALNTSSNRFRIGQPFGAICATADVTTCTSRETALVSYLVYQMGPRDFVSLRGGLFNDRNGQRTGFAAKYTELVLGYNHWIGNAITLRPEIRYEHAKLRGNNNFVTGGPYDSPQDVTGTVNPTANQGKSRQLMFAMDAIIHF